MAKKKAAKAITRRGSPIVKKKPSMHRGAPLLVLKNYKPKVDDAVTVPSDMPSSFTATYRRAPNPGNLTAELEPTVSGTLHGYFIDLSVASTYANNTLKVEIQATYKTGSVDNADSSTEHTKNNAVLISGKLKITIRRTSAANLYDTWTLDNVTFPPVLQRSDAGPRRSSVGGKRSSPKK